MALRIDADGRAALRIVDANLNRAREALRVLEDAQRFGGDPSAAAALRDLRRSLAHAAARLGAPRAALLATRDTARDPGRGEAGVARRHANLAALAAANWGRLTEALRSLEEASRLFSVSAARTFARARFTAYRVEREATLGRVRSARLARARLYLVATPRRGWSAARLARVVRRALAGGAGIVQLRIKGASDRAVLAAAQRVGRICARAGALFIVNDRPDLAVLACADGVHVGQGDLSVAQARRIVGSGRIVGVSTHSARQALAAQAAGADYVGFGPLHATPTKPGRRPVGLATLPRLARRMTIPVFAIGGVSPRTVARVARAGAARVAASAAILDARDPRAVARAILRGLGRPRRRAPRGARAASAP